MLNLREYAGRPRLLADYLPWACSPAPGVILNKDGSFQTTFRYRGPDLDSSTPEELVSVMARIAAAAGLATILGIGTELGAGDEGDVERAIRRGAGDTLNQAGQRIVDRNLGIQPTIRIRPGWPVRVLVTRDLLLRPH